MIKLRLGHDVEKIVAILFLVCIGNAAHATLVTDLVNTGFSQDGQELSVGDTDLNYLINGNGTYVRSALPNWFPNNSDSKLIWIDAGRDNYTTYSFVLNFDLTGFDLASVVIGGR